MTLFIRNRNLYLGASVLVTTHEGRQGFNERVSNTPYFEDAGGHTLANFTRPYDTTVKRFVVTGGTSDGLDYANSSHTGVPNNWRTGIHEITVMASINWTAMPANGGGAFLYDAGTGALPWAIWQSTTTANWIFQISTGTEHATATLAAATGWKVLVGRYLDNQKFSLDQWTTLGVKGTSVTGTNFVGPIVYPPGTALALGRFQSYFSGSSAWAGMWPRSLSDGEVAAVIHAAHGGNSFFSSAPKTIYLSGSKRTNFDADVTNTTAEFGFEATSALVRIVETPDSAEFGWEGTSASVALPESVTPAEFGFEATSAAVRIVDNPNSAEFGFEATSASVRIVENPNSAEFGWEGTSASIALPESVTPAEFGFEATSVAVTIVDTPTSAEFGFEATSAGFTIVDTPTSAEFGFEATSASIAKIFPVKPTVTQILDVTNAFAVNMTDFLLFYENSGVPSNLAATSVVTTTTGTPTWVTFTNVIAGYTSAGNTFNVPDHGNITAGDFSLRIVFALKSYTAFQTLFSKATGSTPGRELSLFLDTSGNPDYMDVGGVFIDASSIPSAFQLNQIYDLVITRSGTTLNFYINGSQSGSSLTSSGTAGQVAAMRLSADAFGGSNGDQDIFVYQTWTGRVLSSSEIVTLYNSPYTSAIDLTISVVSSEFGFEATSAAISLPESVTHAEFGFEATSVAVSLPESVTSVEFGFEATSAAVRIVEVPNSAEFGWEGTSAAVSLPESVTSAEFGFEAKSASLIANIVVVSPEFEFEVLSAATSLPESVTPTEFGFEATSVAVRVVDNPNSAEFGWEGKSVGFTFSIPAAVVDSAEFGYQASSTNLPGTIYSWNPLDYDSFDLVLSHANLLMTATNASSNAIGNGGNWYAGARSTISHTTGKWYFEVTMDANTGNGGIGIGTSSASLNGTRVGGSFSIGYYIGAGDVLGENVFLDNASSGNRGDTVGVAVDLDNSRIWWRVNTGEFTKGGITIDDISLATPTDWYTYSFGGNPIFAMANTLSAGDKQTINFGGSAFVNSIPPSFTSWDGLQAGQSENSYGFEVGSPAVVITLYIVHVVHANFGFEVFVDTTDPITITSDNQVVDGKTIIATGLQNGIDCTGFANVIIRNCLIYHQEGRGIKFNGADNITIQSNNIIKINSTQFTANNSASSNNIDGLSSANPTIGGATANLGNRVEGGATGVYLQSCSTPHVSYLEGHDIRGPFPRGQLVQFNDSSNGEIRHFSIVNDLNNSWTEDNINIFASSNTAISDGVIDGNNSPSGDGVICENVSNNCTIDSVDVINWGNGAFASVGSDNVVFTNCRADLWHADGGRGLSSSNGLTFASFSGATNTSFDSTNIYGTNSSTNILFDVSTMTNHNPIGPVAFVARSPLSLNVPTGKSVSLLIVPRDFDSSPPLEDPSHPRDFGFEVSSFTLQRFVYGLTPNNRLLRVEPDTDRIALTRIYPSYLEFPLAGIDRVVYVLPIRRIVNVIGTGVPINEPNVPPIVPVTLFDIHASSVTMGFDTDGVTETHQNLLRTNNPQFGFEVATASFFQLHTLDVGKPEFGAEFGAIGQIVQGGINVVPAEFGVETKSATMTQRQTVIAVAPTTGWESFGATNLSQSGGGTTSHPNIVPTTDLRNWSFLVGGSTTTLNGTLTADQHNRYDLNATGGRSGVFENMPFTTGTQYSISVDAVGTTPFSFNEWTGISSGNPPNSDNQNSPTFTPTATNTRFTWTFTAAAASAAGGVTSIGIVYNNLSGTVSGTNTFSKFKVEVGAATAYVDPIPVSQAVTTQFTKGGMDVLPMSTFQISGDAITAITTQGFTDLTFTVNVSAQTITITNTSTATTGLKSGNFTISGAFGNTSNQSNIAVTLNAVGTGRVYAIGFTPGGDTFRWSGENSGWAKERIDMWHSFGSDSGSSATEMDAVTWSPAPNGWAVTCQFVTAKGVLDMAAAARGDYNATWKTWFQDWKNVRSNISVIRIWQECNNTDFPWCQASSPQQFIDAWRNVATQARSVFPNTLLEWNLNQGGTTGNNQPNGSIPTTGSNPTHPLYPGDDLVDVVGLDSYEQWDPTLSGGGINHKNLSAFAVARGKKFGISEWAGNGGNCGQNSTSTPCNGAYITNVASFLDGLGATAAYQWYFDNGYCSGNNGGTVLYTTANPQSGDACPASTLQAAWNNSSFGTLAYGGTLPFISQVASPPPAPPPPAPAPPPPAPPPAPPGTISPNIIPTTDFRNWTFLIAGSTLALDGALTADQHNRYDLSATGVRSGVFENVPFVTGTQYSISVDVLGTTPFQFNEWTGISSGNPPNSDNQNSPTFTPTATVITRPTWTFTANAPSAAGGSTSIGIVYNNLGGSVSGTNIYSKFKVEVGGPTAYVDPNPVSKNVTTSFIKGNNITLPMSTFQASGDAITAIHTSGFTDITFNLNISAQTVTIANTSTATTGAKSGTFTLSGAFNNTSNQSTIAITLNAVGSGRLYAVSVSDGTSPALWASEVLWPKQPIDMLDGFTDQTDSYWDGDGQNWNPAPNAHMMTIQWQNPNGGSFDHAAAARGDYNAGWLGFLKTGNRQTMPIAVVRIWQENNLNGSTFGQFANPTDFKNAWNNFAAQVRTAYPNAKIDWNLNQGEHDSGHSGNGSQTVFDTYPGDTYVDIVSIDSYYNSDPNPVSAHPNGYDLTTVANFAKSKGKLFGIGEWAAGKKDPNNGSQGDPNDQCESSYITAVANFLDGLGATAAYQSYYDTGYPNNGGNVLYTTSGGASSPFGCPQNTLRDTWNNSSFGSKPFGGTWSNVLKPLTPVAKPVPPNPTSTIPTRVVIDSIGINTHIDFNNGTNPGYSSIQNVINSINFLGIKHIRDCPAQTADLSGARAWSVVAAGTGAKFLAFIGQTSLVNAQTQLDRMDTLAGQGILYGLDGPNEWDDPFPMSQGVDLTKAIAFQQKVWDKGIKLQLPVMNLSIGAGFSAANNFVGDYGVVGDLSAICTCANPHTYQVVGQTVSNTINRLNGLAQMAAPGNPNLTTEIGWDNNNFTEANAAIYAQQVIFAGILKSDVKCYYYALFDDVNVSPPILFGLMRTDGTPKPAGQAVHNVMAVLADTGVGPDRSDPLTYTTTGKISNDSIIVMQKSTGTFQLAIWNEIDAAHNVTINFGAVKSSIKTYIPLNSVSAITTATNVQSVSVSVGNPVVIVEMTP